MLFILKSVFTVFYDHKQVIRQLFILKSVFTVSYDHKLKLKIKLKVLLTLDLDNFGDDWRFWFQSWTKGLSSPKAE